MGASLLVGQSQASEVTSILGKAVLYLTTLAVVRAIFVLIIYIKCFN